MFVSEIYVLLYCFPLSAQIQAELARTVTVQYPIQIESIAGPSHLGGGEIGVLHIAVSNSVMHADSLAV